MIELGQCHWKMRSMKVCLFELIISSQKFVVSINVLLSHTTYPMTSCQPLDKNDQHSLLVDSIYVSDDSFYMYVHSMFNFRIYKSLCYTFMKFGIECLQYNLPIPPLYLYEIRYNVHNITYQYLRYTFMKFGISNV